MNYMIALLIGFYALWVRNEEGKRLESILDRNILSIYLFIIS
jgi:uncharacterized membrane protein YfhO